MSYPAISVVIPVYNGGKYIQETIESVLNQTFTDFELICIDDCSTDNSFEIINKYANLDSRVAAFKTPENLGDVPHVINYILDRISGRYFVYSSQDDFFSVDWLESMHSRAQFTQAGAVVPIVVPYYEGMDDDPGNSITGYYGDVNAIISNRDAFIAALDFSIAGNALWKMEIVKKIGIKLFSYNADEFAVRMWFYNAEKVAFSSGVFYYRLDNPDAITRKISKKMIYSPLVNYYLYRFMKQEGFPRGIYSRQAMRAASSLFYHRKLISNNLIENNDGVAFSQWKDVSNAIAGKELFFDLLSSFSPKATFLLLVTYSNVLGNFFSKVLRVRKKRKTPKK